VLFNTHVSVTLDHLHCYRYSRREKKLVIKSPSVAISVTELIKKNMIKKQYELRQIIDIKVR